jgi:glycerophosphoryl diester phosphodiesterase
MSQISSSSALFHPDWLVQQPYAHRGLHDVVNIIENTLAAAQAAADAGYGIECDVQLTQDGEAVVFHDDDLERLTAHRGHIQDYKAAFLANVSVKAKDFIPTLIQFLEFVQGRVPVIIEIKSAFDGNPVLARRVTQIVSAYSGPVALKSFDPFMVIEARSAGALCPLGIVAQSDFSASEWGRVPKDQRFSLSNLLHFPISKPDFLSWNIHDLPSAAPFLARHLGQVPLLAWTVRTETERAKAALHADQIIFEG